MCVFAGAQFHRREVGCYLWKHACVENNQINKFQFDTVAEIIGIFLAHHLHMFSSLFSDQVASPYLFFCFGLCNLQSKETQEMNAAVTIVS